MKTLILLCIFLYLTDSVHTQTDTSYTAKKDTTKSVYDPFKKKTIDPFGEVLSDPFKKVIIKKDTAVFIYNPFKKKIIKVQSQSSQAQLLESETNNSYIVRIAGEDNENNINFYGVCLAGFHSNNSSIFSGLTFNVAMGNRLIDMGKPLYDMSINGINFSLLITTTRGSINGFSFGGFYGSESGNMNGIAVGGIGAGADFLNGIAIGGLGVGAKFLNGLAIGGLGCTSENANAIQIGGILNAYCKFNGIGLALINIFMESFHCENDTINGLILGGYNGVDVNGISIGAVNIGNSWIQIGIVNKGNSTIQIGLLNFDEFWKFNFPLISIRL